MESEASDGAFDLEAPTAEFFAVDRQTTVDDMVSHNGHAYDLSLQAATVKRAPKIFELHYCLQ